MNNNKPPVERHLQSIGIGVLLAFAGWTATVVIELQVDIAVLQTQVESLRKQLDVAASDRFTGTDWRIEKAEITRRLQELEKWLMKQRDGKQYGLQRDP